jgi:ABC-type sugar transport system ATPase subunit
MLEVTLLTKTFGALRATDGVDLDVAEGETHAIIGPNGAGKTTLIGQLAGNLRPDSGSIRFAGEDITRLPAPRRARKGLARSFQITSIYRDFTALQNVALAVQAHAGHSFRFWRRAHRFDAAGSRRRVLEEVGLESEAMSGGQPLARRAAPARGGHGARQPAAPPAPRRADGRHGHRGIAAHDRLPRHAQAPPHHHPRRARHGCGVPPRRPHLGPRLRARDRNDVPEKIKQNGEVRRAYLGEDA